LGRLLEQFYLCTVSYDQSKKKTNNEEFDEDEDRPTKATSKQNRTKIEKK